MKKVNLVFVLAVGLALFVCTSGVSNIVNVASANSNDGVANATILNELNGKTANNTFPSNTTTNIDDYTLTEFEEGADAKAASLDWNATKRTTSYSDKIYPQLQVVGDKIYYVWVRKSGSYNSGPIWIATMNVNGSGWQAEQKGGYANGPVQFYVSGDAIYYVWSQDGQIWTAVSNIDGSGWSATQRTTSLNCTVNPQFHVRGNRIYYVYQESDHWHFGSFATSQIVTAEMNIDGSGWIVTHRTTSKAEHSPYCLFDKHNPQLWVTGSKIYYTWREGDDEPEYIPFQIWTASANAGGGDWIATKRTWSDYPDSKCKPNIQVEGSMVYITWGGCDNSTDPCTPQIWTATMNTGGTGWSARTISRYTEYDHPHDLYSHGVGGRWYYIWIQDTDTGYSQIWTAVSPGWHATKRTISPYDKIDPQFQVVGDKMYYVWSEEDDNGKDQIWTAGSPLQEAVPVLLIHGYHSKPGMWAGMASYLEGKGFIVERLDYSSGGANKKIQSYDLDLALKINEMRQKYSVDKVDIVAHSMGGLITRHHMKGFGRSSVRKFVMIGTPNHGSNLTYLADDIIKKLPCPLDIFAHRFKGEAGKDMTPHSPFLNSLNYGNPEIDAGVDYITPNVEYYTIAGFDDTMGIPQDSIKNIALRLLIKSFLEQYLEGSDDTVVRVDSVELNNGVEGSYKVNEWHCNEGNNQEIQIIVEDILKGDSKSASAFSKFGASAKGKEDYSIQKVSEFSETIYQGQDRSYNVNISLANEASFPLFWDDGTLNLTLVTPNGTFIDPSVAESNPDMEYGYDANGTMQGYFIKNPESGNWTLNIHAVNTPEDGTNYSMVLLLNTTLILDSSQNGYVYRPNEQINITANLANNGTAVTGALLVASIKRPDNTTETVTLYDDGSHNDNESNDGIYANTYTNTSLWGTYDITITASGILNEEDFQREAFTTMWVAQYPDLTLNASDISFSSETPTVGEHITINATIHNIGEADANNTSILFYDGEPASGEEIGEDVVNVSVNATANASVSWLAKAGVHEIHVLISPYNEFLEGNSTNNMANKTIEVNIRGDLNHDGEVTPTDAAIALNLAVRGEYDITADVSRDGRVTSLDALMILQAAAGAISL